MAERAWQSFFIALRAAVNKRNRGTLKEMMAPDFFYTIAHHASDQRDAAFAYWDESRGRGWKAFKLILAKGTVRTADKSLSSNGEFEGPMRVAPPAAARRRSFTRNLIDWYAVFEFHQGRWYCITFIDCCETEPSAQSNRRLQRTGISVALIDNLSLARLSSGR
jgi:hypothetical protein